jgi:hypothetical protein
MLSAEKLFFNFAKNYGPDFYLAILVVKHYIFNFN